MRAIVYTLHDARVIMEPQIMQTVESRIPVVELAIGDNFGPAKVAHLSKEQLEAIIRELTFILRELP